MPIDQENNELNLPNTVVVESKDSVKIVQFEVFKNYLAVLQERNG